MFLLLHYIAILECDEVVFKIMLTQKNEWKILIIYIITIVMTIVSKISTLLQSYNLLL